MKVLVAGATGAIGAQLVPQLLEQGHEVAALTRSRERAGALAAAGAEPVVCDVFDREALVDEVRRRRPEVVVNELTDLPDRLDPRRLDAIYAPNNRVRREGTANLLAAARAGDAPDGSSRRARRSGTRPATGSERRKTPSTSTLPSPSARRFGRSGASRTLSFRNLG
jgi:nucleoside-diphosphate-sugar epimerase